METKNEKKSTWAVLSAINCNEHTEQKNGLTYLSWAWAWGIVKTNFPDANYRVRQYDGKPYLFDENLGYLVTTEVTICGETIEMSLPVMDVANKAQKNVAYSYSVKEHKDRKWTGNYTNKEVEPATMFDINTAIMRCLTKNLAMFGLGHYIYAGEDLPQVDEDEKALAVIDYLANNEKAGRYFADKYKVQYYTALNETQFLEIYDELKKNKRI